MMKKIDPGGGSTTYIGSIYEVQKNAGGTVTGTTTFYPAAGAMRVGGTLYYVLGDQLGSASAVLNASGNTVGETRYYPFGETRATSGSMYTDRLYTGQRDMASLGLYFYNARFYDAGLGRFISPDSIIAGAGNPQALNRYAYGINNPIRYNDPTGHFAIPVWAAVTIAIGVGMIAGAIGGAAGYSAGILLTGGKFDWTSFRVATVGGGIGGGIMVAVAIASPEAATFTAPLVNGVVSVGQFYVDRKLHDDSSSITVANIGISFIAGTLGSTVGGSFSSQFIGNGSRQFLMEAGEQTMFQGTKQIFQQFIDEQTETALNGSARNFGANLVTQIVEGISKLIQRNTLMEIK